MTNGHDDAQTGEWFEAIPAWSPAQRRTARWCGFVFGALIVVVPALRVVAPAPAATPAPLPAFELQEVLSGEWMDQFDRHLKETSWLTVVLRSTHDEVLRRVGWPRSGGLLGEFGYETPDGERFLPSQFAELMRRGFIVPVPGEVGVHLPRVRLRIAPNQSFFLCYRDNDQLRRDWFDQHGRVPVRLEGNGLRERPEVTTVPKPAGQQRVLCLGDSMTFGWGVPEELGWVRLVEDDLRRDRGEVRTVNCGAAGTNCVDEYAAGLLHRFAGLAPDAVVVGLCLNDLVPSSGLSVIAPAGETSFAEALQGKPKRSALDLDPSVDWVDLLLKLPRGEGEAAFLYRDDQPFEDMWSQGGPQRDLRTIQAFCKARSIPMLVVLWPFLQGLGEGRTYPFERLHQLVAADCEAAGIAFVDVLPALRDTPQEDLWVTPADMHPNPRAHRLAAGRIGAALRAAWPR